MLSALRTTLMLLTVQFAVCFGAPKAGTPAGTSASSRRQLQSAACTADFDGNGVVEVTDLLVQLGVFGSGADGDVDGDDDTDVVDLLALLGVFGGTCEGGFIGSEITTTSCDGVCDDCYSPSAMATGEQYYCDEAYTFLEVPEFLQGVTFIQTSESDRTVDGGAASAATHSTAICCALFSFGRVGVGRRAV